MDMHMDISKEPFCMEIYRENAGRPWYHLGWKPGLNCDDKNPFSVATLLQEKHQICRPAGVFCVCASDTSLAQPNFG